MSPGQKGDQAVIKVYYRRFILVLLLGWYRNPIDGLANASHTHSRAETTAGPSPEEQAREGASSGGDAGGTGCGHGIQNL
jgi:hypothetical protein